MDILLENKLENYFEDQKTLSRMELINAIHRDFPEWTPSTITVYMSKLKKSGKLGSPSRGIYTLNFKNTFQPPITNTVKKLYNKINQQYPYVNCCIWDTKWLSSLMRHQPFRHYIVIEVEKDVMSQAFNSISDVTKNVYLNPDSNIFDYYIANSNEAIIIKPIVSEAPVEKQKKVVIATLEKLLVDMLIDTELFAAQQGEIKSIYRNAFELYSINTLKMKRYAVRRNREEEVIKQLNLISAK